MNITEILEKHKKWLNGEPGGLRANLQDANLQGANLQGADLDYSCLSLWRGSTKMLIDKRIAAQFAYHFCSMICDDPEVKEIQKSLYDFANTFHRVGEVPRLGEGGKG